MKNSEFLLKAKRKISNPENWIKGCYAANKDGVDVIWSHKNACKFCSVGVLLSINGAVIDNHPIRFLEDACKTSVIAFNDSSNTTHTDVMKMFDDAIELAKQKE